MTYVLAGLIALIVLHGLGQRARLASLVELPPSTAAPSPDHRFVCAPDVTLDDATRRAASAWATRHGLDVVDLVPAVLPTLRATGFAQLVDPARIRRERFAPGRTAGHAMLVSTEVAARAAVEDPADEVAMVRLAARLKTYAPRTFGYAIAPAERARGERLERRRAVLAATLGEMTTLALLAQPAFWLLLGLGVWARPILGGVAVGLWHLQPLVELAGTRLRPRDLAQVTIARAPLELYLVVRTLAGGWSPPGAADQVALRRPVYQALLAADRARFWESRRDACPICGGRELRVYLRVGDLVQHKPGRFALERCATCRHIFQNPQLSLAGLDFYYKDCYDGLGEDKAEQLFGQGVGVYRDRARMVREVAQPRAWLDVGAGHGHFCCIARDELPDTRFDGLDLSESVDEAHRRRWIDTAYRGLFPDLAPRLEGAYDAISMSHYLEHTLDPRRELAAAHTALASGGHLMIEVPDPEFRIGRMLGRWWLPWMQPQHLHLLSTANLDQLLREHGFTPLTWHCAEAHQHVDFTLASLLVLGWMAPPPDVPWRRGGIGARARRGLVWSLGAPLILIGWIADHAVAPIVRRSRHANTYRVLARRG